MNSNSTDRVELVKKFREMHHGASLKDGIDAVNDGWTPETDSNFFDNDLKWAVAFSGILAHTGKEVAIGLITGLTKAQAEQFRKDMFVEIRNGDQIIEFDNGAACGKITLPHYAVYSLFVTDNV
jgi:hypothetical protein